MIKPKPDKYKIFPDVDTPVVASERWLCDTCGYDWGGRIPHKTYAPDIDRAKGERLMYCINDDTPDVEYPVSTMCSVCLGLIDNP